VLLRYLGIDPGKNGGAVIVSPGPWGSSAPQLEFWCYWSPDNGGFRVTIATGDFAIEDLSVLSEYFGEVSRAAVEALFVGPARQSIIGTAETAGALIGAAIESLVKPRQAILRPSASRWRSDLLRLPGGTTALQADKYARKVIEQIMPDNQAWKSGHAVDAACIALWCSGMRGRATHSR